MEKEKILQLVATALGDARQATVIVLTTDHVLTDREPVPVMSEPSPALSRNTPTENVTTWLASIRATTVAVAVVQR